MNRKIRNKIKKLGLKREFFRKQVDLAGVFIFNNEKNFRKEESKKAFLSMRKKISDISNEINEITDEINILTEECSHEVIINGGNKYCPICGKCVHGDFDNSIIIDIDETIYIGQSSFLLFMDNIDYDYLDNDNKDIIRIINETIENTIDDEDFSYVLCQTINDLSYDKNIKIRRLMK